MQIKFAKFFALMLAAMMVFCVVAGCQPQNPTGGDQQTNPPTTDTTSDPNAGTETTPDPNAGTDPVAPELCGRRERRHRPSGLHLCL